MAEALFGGHQSEATSVRDSPKAPESTRMPLSVNFAITSSNKSRVIAGCCTTPTRFRKYTSFSATLAYKPALLVESIREDRTCRRCTSSSVLQ